jgi:hypothetical protein
MYGKRTTIASNHAVVLVGSLSSTRSEIRNYFDAGRSGLYPAAPRAQQAATDQIECSGQLRYVGKANVTGLSSSEGRTVLMNRFLLAK